jgi:hypothetical protein
MEVQRVIEDIDTFVDSLTEEEIKLLQPNLSLWYGQPRQAVGVLVQRIMHPDRNINSNWVQSSQYIFEKEGRENTWNFLYLLFRTFHKDSFENIESHKNYSAFVTALKKLEKARGIESVRTEFKTVLKEVLRCLLPSAEFKTMVKTNQQ